MSRRLPLGWLLTLLAALLAGAVLFAVFNSSFGGPLGSSLPLSGGSDSTRLRAVLPDAQGLLHKSLILVRGVEVGEVADVTRRGNQVSVALAIDPAKTTVYRDATLSVGHRTLFGEAYVNLDPGHRRAGPLPQAVTLPAARVHDTVELDEALQTFDAGARRHLRSLVGTAANVHATPDSAARLNATFSGLAATLVELRGLSTTLGDQGENLRGLVLSSSAIADELAARQAAVATLVSDGADTARALTGDSDALRQSVAESSRLLGSAHATLGVLSPLISEARPFVADLTAAAPSLSVALAHLRPAARSAGTVIRGLPALDRSALPVLTRLRTLSSLAKPMLPQLEPVLRDLVPTLRYLAPYGREFVGFLGAGTAIRVLTPDGHTRYLSYKEDRDAHPYEHPGVDNAYGWSRFFLDTSPGLGIAQQTGIGVNPYPQPGDPTSHFSGTYPRLTPEPLPRP